MNPTTKDRIRETQLNNWERRRRGLEQLEALRTTHKRVLEVMGMMTPLIEMQARLGDPLAKYLIDELEKAEIARQAEHVAASDLLAEHESSTS